MTPENMAMSELVKLITSLRFFGDTIHPPNGLYVDLIREAWLDAVSTSIDADVSISNSEKFT